MIEQVIRLWLFVKSFARVPKKCFKCRYAVVLNGNTFLFQHFLHKSRRWKMVPAAQFAFAVDHPVRRNIA